MASVISRRDSTPVVGKKLSEPNRDKAGKGGISARDAMVSRQDGEARQQPSKPKV